MATPRVEPEGYSSKARSGFSFLVAIACNSARHSLHRRPFAVTVAAAFPYRAARQTACCDVDRSISSPSELEAFHEMEGYDEEVRHGRLARRPGARSGVSSR